MQTRPHVIRLRVVMVTWDILTGRSAIRLRVVMMAWAALILRTPIGPCVALPTHLSRVGRCPRQERLHHRERTPEQLEVIL